METEVSNKRVKKGICTYHVQTKRNKIKSGDAVRRSQAVSWGISHILVSITNKERHRLEFLNKTETLIRRYRIKKTRFFS